MKYKNYNDYELIYMIRENDDASYDILFQKYLPIIRRIAMDCYQGFQNYGYDYDDFLQEGYFAFQKALLSYHEEKDILFYTFASLCIRRKLYSFCRKISNDKKNINSEYLVDCDDTFIEDMSIDIEKNFSYQELWKSIWDVVYQFSLDFICVFELRIHQFSFSQIEELLEISTRRAQTMMNKIQKEIRQKVDFSF